MKNTAFALAFATASALAAPQYPLNRVAYVNGSGTDGINELIRAYDETNLTARIDAAALPPGNWETVSNRAENARLLDDNVSRVDSSDYGPWDLADATATFGSQVSGMGLDPSGPAWVLRDADDAELARSADYPSERDALAATEVTVSSGSSSATVTRASARAAYAGESFVTRSTVTNALAGVPAVLAETTNAVMEKVDSVIGGKRDLVDDVCRKTSGQVFGDWLTVSLDSYFGGTHSVTGPDYAGPEMFVYTVRRNGGAVAASSIGARDELESWDTFRCREGYGDYSGWPVRRPVLSATCVSNELFTTESFVTNAIVKAMASGVFTNENGSVAIGPGSSVDRSFGLNEARFAIGVDCRATGMYATAMGLGALANGTGSFVWNGHPVEGYSTRGSGGGQFCVNPVGGPIGFYVGDSNLVAIVTQIVRDLVAAGRLQVSTNGGSSAVSGWQVRDRGF